MYKYDHTNNDNYYYDENDCTKQGTWGHCKITLPNENDILLRDYHTSVSSDSPLYNDRATCESINSQGSNGQKRGDNHVWYDNCYTGNELNPLYHNENDCVNNGQWGACYINKGASLLSLTPVLS